MVQAHHLAGGLHLRPQDGVDAWEAGEGEHRLLDGHVRRERGVVQLEGGQRRAGHDQRADLGHRHPRRLGHEGHGAAGARVDLQDVDGAVLDGELHVHQADHAERAGDGLCLVVQLVDGGRRQAVWRQRARAVAGMDAGLLDVLHHACDVDGAAVGDAVDIDLDRVVEVAVDQHGVAA